MNDGRSAHVYVLDDTNARVRRTPVAVVNLEQRHAVIASGLKPGDRVATLAWSTHRHFELYFAVTGIGALSSAPLLWIFGLVSGIADFSVGLLLGFGLVSTYVFRGNAQAIEKGAMLRDKLAAFQVPLGALAILVSVAYGALYYV